MYEHINDKSKCCFPLPVVLEQLYGQQTRTVLRCILNVSEMKNWADLNMQLLSSNVAPWK